MKLGAHPVRGTVKEKAGVGTWSEVRTDPPVSAFSSFLSLPSFSLASPPPTTQPPPLNLSSPPPLSPATMSNAVAFPDSVPQEVRDFIIEFCKSSPISLIC